MSSEEMSLRVSAAEWLRRGSLVLLCSALVLSSFTFRWYLIMRPPPHVHQEFSGSVLYISDIPLIAAVVLWLLAHYVDRKPVRNGPWYITGPALILVVVSLLSSFWAVRPELALETGVRILLLFCIYLIALNEAGRSRLFMLILMIGLALQASVAVGQFVNREPLGLASLGEMPRGFDSVCRVYGLTTHSNNLGGFLAFILPVVFAFYLSYSHRRLTCLAILAALALGTAGLIVTGSYEAWVGWGAGLALMLFFIFVARPRVFSLRSVMVALLVMAFVWAFFGVRNPEIFAYRFAPLVTSTPAEAGGEVEQSVASKVEQYVLSGRLKHISESGQLIGGHLLGGVGAGNYAVAFDRLVASPGPPYPIHSVPLLVTGELGVVGGICWLVLVASPFVFLAANRRQVGKGAMLLCWSGALLAIAAISLIDYFTWGAQEGRVFLWAVLGFWAGYAAQLQEPSSV